MRVPSVSQHNFAQVPKAEIPRSSFDRSHGYKTTFDAGYLVPFFVDEALPGDTFNLNMTGFARMATPVFPIMDNVFLETQFFFVPYRLVWDNWERFNGAQDDPGDSTDYVVPTVSTGGGSGQGVGSLFDYFGIPTGVGDLYCNALPFRAYNLIWNEWYRDQNLQDSVAVAKGDGPDSWSAYPLLRRGKRHDYFTSCLPWPQKGDSVDLPLGTVAPITGLGVRTTTNFATGPVTIEETGGGTTSYPYYVDTNTATGVAILGTAAGSSGEPAVYADLSEATAATINQLRQAFQVQRLYERDARGGTRYTEIIRAHFGVVSPDQRLQRPEYLGGGRTMVNISPVAQTSQATDAGEPGPGTLGAFATATLKGHGFTKSFTEHGVVIGLMSVRADLTYQQGLNRMWSRATRFDFYWPALSHIGEQAVLNKEIYAQGTSADEEVFGYQERYGEYRYKPSQITGLFRSTAAASLDAWHLAQEFSALPTLSDTFIQENPPLDRVIAVSDEPHFLFDSYIQLRCARPMPMFGVPGLIDHF